MFVFFLKRSIQSLLCMLQEKLIIILNQSQLIYVIALLFYFHQPIEQPVRTNQIPRQIPDQVLYCVEFKTLTDHHKQYLSLQCLQERPLKQITELVYFVDPKRENPMNYLPPFLLIHDFGKQNTHRNVSKIFISLACY